jgi:hypothetical protein
MVWCSAVQCSAVQCSAVQVTPPPTREAASMDRKHPSVERLHCTPWSTSTVDSRLYGTLHCFLKCHVQNKKPAFLRNWIFGSPIFSLVGAEDDKRLQQRRRRGQFFGHMEIRLLREDNCATTCGAEYIHTGFAENIYCNRHSSAF